MGLTSLGGNEWAREGFNQYVITEKVDAPNTQIEGRDQVSNALKPVMGIERVSAVSLNLMDKEFGPNGENVYSIDNDDSRIRIVGESWVANVDHGTHIQGSAINDFMEVTFYGTGLNLLVLLTATSRDVRPTIDGGAEGANIYSSHSSVLASRSYATNQVLSVASGLTLGWHTIKLRIATATGTPIYGFEFLNERADVGVAPGNGFDGHQKQSIASLTTSSYNAGVVGTRGARVLKYIKDGAVSQAVQEVGSQLNFGSADHSNEDILKRINFREFGVNRGDDFSTLTGPSSDRAFTLDDGTTTLVGDDVFLSSYNGIEGVGSEGGGVNQHTLTFVGTGLDVFLSSDGSDKSWNMIVDGASIGTISRNTFANDAVVKIVSGLPYGTHTVKFLTNSASNGPSVIDFIIYGPKKPVLPAGAVEVADYNVLGDFSANTNENNGFISQGVIRKVCAREMDYHGTWSINLDTPNRETGFLVFTSTNSDYIEYTFFGTGFDFKAIPSSGGDAALVQVTVDGGTDFSLYASTTSTNTSFVAATGVYDLQGAGSTTDIASLTINGFDLDVHTVRFAKTGGGALRLDALDIITPVHINDPSFKVGSKSLDDSRKLSPIEEEIAKKDWSKAKGLIHYDTANDRVLMSNNISAVIDRGAGQWNIYMKHGMKTMEGLIAIPMSSQSTNRTMYYGALSKSHFEVFSKDSGGSASDPGKFAIAVFGELENEENLDLDNL